MRSFEMLHPTTVPEAVGLLTSHGTDARPYAGSQDLLHRYQHRLSSNLLNLKAIPDLDRFAVAIELPSERQGLDTRAHPSSSVESER